MNVSNFKLGIGIPLSYHLIPSEFFDAFIAMEKPGFVYMRTAKGNIEEMRNTIVMDALTAGCTHLLMMDTDQLYPPDALTKMLAHKRPIVGARIRRRYPPFDNLLFRGTVGEYVTVPHDECVSGQLIEVDATGAGCLLLDTRIFRKILAPWFVAGTHNGRPVGEDFGFCGKARAAGIPIYVDTSVYLPHLTQMGITDGFAAVYERVTAIANAQPAMA